MLKNKNQLLKSYVFNVKDTNSKTNFKKQTYYFKFLNITNLYMIERKKKECYLNNHFVKNLWNNHNLQRKVGICTKTKSIER